MWRGKMTQQAQSYTELLQTISFNFGVSHDECNLQDW